MSHKHYKYQTLLTGDSGRYQCSGFHRSLNCIKNSNIISLIVSDKPKAKVTSGSTIIPVGGRVTLSCSVDDSDGWKYDWFRRTSNSNEAQVDGEENRDITVSQEGVYRCRGRRGEPVYYTDYSDEVSVEITDAVLTLDPNWSSFYTGESVTFICDMKEGKHTDWEYRWSKDEKSDQIMSHKHYKYQTLLTEDSGRYQCSGFHRSLNCIKKSNIISLIVSDKPKAKVTAGPTIIPVGGRVTLSCSVDDSDGWKYDWFRRTSNSNEAQVVGEENRDIRVSQGGIYRCRGRRGEPVYYTDYSDEVTVEIT
uniref:Ig-like domain-containing protein n=1 Tax=Anabas testudineus TaxID=64144 RepID=A0A3Q1HEA2_ANATE